MIEAGHSGRRSQQWRTKNKWHYPVALSHERIGQTRPRKRKRRTTTTSLLSVCCYHVGPPTGPDPKFWQLDLLHGSAVHQLFLIFFSSFGSDFLRIAWTCKSTIDNSRAPPLARPARRASPKVVILTIFFLFPLTNEKAVDPRSGKSCYHIARRPIGRPIFLLSNHAVMLEKAPRLLTF